MKKILLLILLSFPLVSWTQITDAQVYHDKLIDEARNVAGALNKFNTSLHS